MAPITHSTSTDSKCNPASPPLDDAPTLSTIMLALDRFKSDLQHDLQDVRQAISTTNTDLDHKVASVSSTLATLQDHADGNIKNLRSDLSAQINTTYLTVNGALLSARSEWHQDIDTSILTTRHELDSTVQSVTSSLHATNVKLDSMIDTFMDKITTIENLTVSDPQVLRLLNDATLDHIRNLTLSPAINDVISRAVTENIAPISQDILDLKNSTTISTSPRPKLGFAQVESKDFCVSKFTKELERVKLQGDTLRDLELFWDSIQRALMNVCQVNQVFPYYRDLTPIFTLRLHLLGDPRQPKFSSSNFDQAKRNYRSFGDALRFFLHTTTTIEETTCPPTPVFL
jgi:hypothetical protein